LVDHPLAWEESVGNKILQFEAIAVWDDPKKETTLRVYVTTDDGTGWRFNLQSAAEFTVGPDSEVV
jgi:hypothetical protein